MHSLAMTPKFIKESIYKSALSPRTLNEDENLLKPTYELESDENTRKSAS
jgi:hypothetical protein